MQFACEIVPSNYLTPLRRILARELAKQDYTQIEIARILGVSQPVVSSYLKSSETGTQIITSRPAFKTLVSNLLIQVKKGLTSPTDLMKMMCIECQKFRIAGPICDIHRKLVSYDFPADCSICFPTADQAAVFGKKLEVIKELYEAAHQLIAMEEKFGQLIPEIGCQFVYIVEGSNIQEDIAGFPGRIVKLKGKGKIVSYPEFGQSSTLAMILSYFQQQNSPYRTIITLRSTSENLRMVNEEKQTVNTTEGDKNWKETLKSIPKEEIKQIEVIADSGGLGLEPILYLFGKNPLELAEFLIDKFG